MWPRLAFGLYSEITSFIGTALAAAFLIAAAAAKKGRVRCWLWIPVGLSAAGYAALLTMPAELGAKQASLTLRVLLNNFDRSTRMLQTHALPLLIVWAVLFALGLYARLSRERLTLSFLLAGAAVAANYMLTAASYYPERCAVTTVTLLILACAAPAAALCRTRFQTVCACGCGALAVLFAFSLLLGTADILRTNADYRLRELTVAQAKEAGGPTDLTLCRITASTKYSPFYGQKDLDTEDRAMWPNWQMSVYFGVDSILGQ